MNTKVLRRLRGVTCAHLFVLCSAPLVGLLAAAECFAQEHKEHKATAPIIVRMTDGLRFKPARLVVHAGDTVEWMNTSSLVHTVTADARRAAKGDEVVLPPGAAPFDSGKIKPGGSYRHTFTVPGTYKYICVPHAELGMTGEVIVQPRPVASTHPHTQAPPQPPREADGGPPLRGH
jgi:plastocyanin